MAEILDMNMAPFEADFNGINPFEAADQQLAQVGALGLSGIETTFDRTAEPLTTEHKGAIMGTGFSSDGGGVDEDR